MHRRLPGILYSLLSMAPVEQQQTNNRIKQKLVKE